MLRRGSRHFPVIGEAWNVIDNASHSSIRKAGQAQCFTDSFEGTGIEVLDPRFAACIIGHARVERLWTGARWSEGPAWFAAGRYLVWSDIPNNRHAALR